MTRQPQPYFRKQTQSWYLNLRGRKVPLGKSEADAWSRYYEVMAGRVTPDKEQPVNALFNAYLDWVRDNQSPATYELRTRYLLSFSAFIGNTMTVAQLKSHHLQSWIDQSYKGRRSGTRRIAAISVKRAFNWAVDSELIEVSPVRRYKTAPIEYRDVFITPEIHEKILALTPKQENRDLVTTLWETGCRPTEIRLVEAKNFEPAIGEHGAWVFSYQDSKGRARRRVVRLTPKALEITQRQCAKYPTGKLFRTRDGRPLTTDAIIQRFEYLSKKLDFKVCAYMYRHGAATDMLKMGMSRTAVAMQLGHQTPQMVDRVYGHIDQDPEFMKAQLALRHSPVVPVTPMPQKTCEIL